LSFAFRSNMGSNASWRLSESSRDRRIRSSCWRFLSWPA